MCVDKTLLTVNTRAKNNIFLQTPATLIDTSDKITHLLYIFKMNWYDWTTLIVYITIALCASASRLAFCYCYVTNQHEVIEIAKDCYGDRVMAQTSIIDHYYQHYTSHHWVQTTLCSVFRGFFPVHVFSFWSESGIVFTLKYILKLYDKYEITSGLLIRAIGYTVRTYYLWHNRKHSRLYHWSESEVKRTIFRIKLSFIYIQIEYMF